MDNKEQQELLDEIKEKEEAIKRIQSQIEENERIMRDIKKEQAKNRVKIVKTEISILFHKIWINVKFVIKSPAVLIFLIFLAIRSIWDENLRAMIMNIYFGRYDKDEMRIIFGHFNTLITHIAFIFYILILAWHTLLG